MNIPDRRTLLLMGRSFQHYATYLKTCSTPEAKIELSEVSTMLLLLDEELHSLEAAEQAQEEDTSRWDVVALDDEGNWKVLLANVSYHDADSKVDRYSDQFPHAIIDVVPHSQEINLTASDSNA